MESALLPLVPSIISGIGSLFSGDNTEALQQPDKPEENTLYNGSSLLYATKYPEVNEKIKKKINGSNKDELSSDDEKKKTFKTNLKTI